MSVCEVQIGEVTYELTVGPFSISGMPICGIETGTYTDDRQFVVCKTFGTATVTASCSPTVDENDLPGCWSLSGGTGSGKLERAVDLSTAGTTVITAAAGDDSQKTLTITVVEVGSVGFSNDNAPIPADGSSTSTADASILPSGRTIEWSLLCNETGSSISSSGVITAGTTGGKVTVRAADSAFPDCYSETEIDIVEISDVGFDSVSLISESSATVQAVAATAPFGRTSITWSIQGDAKGCSISATGEITPGSETGTITVRATDSVLTAVYDEAGIEVCGQCMEDTSLKINSVTLDGGEVYCSGETVTSTVRLTGYCCKGYEYEGSKNLSVTLPSTPGDHDGEVVSVSVCGVTLRASVPGYTIVEFGEIGFCPPRIAADGEDETQASVVVCPANRSIKWSIVEGDTLVKSNKHASIDESTGVVTAKTAAGKVFVRAYDSENPDCYVENNSMVVDCSTMCGGGDRKSVV